MFNKMERVLTLLGIPREPHRTPEPRFLIGSFFKSLQRFSWELFVMVKQRL